MHNLQLAVNRTEIDEQKALAAQMNREFLSYAVEHIMKHDNEEKLKFFLSKFPNLSRPYDNRELRTPMSLEQLAEYYEAKKIAAHLRFLRMVEE